MINILLWARNSKYREIVSHRNKVKKLLKESKRNKRTLNWRRRGVIYNWILPFWVRQEQLEKIEEIEEKHNNVVKLSESLLENYNKLLEGL